MNRTLRKVAARFCPQLADHANRRPTLPHEALAGPRGYAAGPAEPGSERDPSARVRAHLASRERDACVRERLAEDRGADDETAAPSGADTPRPDRQLHA